MYKEKFCSYQTYAQYLGSLKKKRTHQVHGAWNYDM